MKKVIIGISIALLVFWVLGFFILHLSGLIHTVLILSMVLFLRCILTAPVKNVEANMTE